MAKANLLDLIQNTINDIQTENRNDPNQQTADPTVFDFLKNKVREVHQNNQDRKANGQRPVRLMDLIKGKIEESRHNKGGGNVPNNLLDRFRDKLDQQQQVRHQERSEESIAEIIQEYNIDVSRLNREELTAIQRRYVADNQKMDEQYATYIHQLNQQR